MAPYQANDELVEILKKQGFIETSSERDKLKGKKCFKLSKNAQKEIYFDYENIEVNRSIHGQDHKYKLTELELKALIL